MKYARVLVCAHDAGGANQALHLWRNSRDATFVLTGPAADIARSLNIPYTDKIEDHTHLKYETVICASNSEEQLSDQILQFFSAQSFQTIGILDHWINYRNRWTSPPGRIVTTDWRAFVKALLIFGWRVRFRRSQYIIDLKKEYLELLSTKFSLKKDSESKIGLFLVQTYANEYSHNNDPKTCICPIIEMHIANLSRIRLLIRDHHLTNSGECLCFLRGRHPRLQVQIVSPYESLSMSLAKTDFVFGFDTYAMYVAKRLGLPVFHVASRRRSFFAPRYRNLKNFNSAEV